MLVPFHGANAATAVAKPLSSAPTIDGGCSDSTYSDAGTFSDAGIDGKVGTYVSFVYICITTTDTSNDGANDFARIYFDRDHNGSPLTPGDRRFAITSGSGQVTPESRRGSNDGTAWEDCPLSGSPSAIECDSGNLAAGAYSVVQRYEFKISFTDVWNTTTPDPNDRAGFAVIVTNGSGGTYTWGSTNPPTDLNPNTWGHLDIPEFQEIVPGAALTVVLIGAMCRSRRRKTGSNLRRALPPKLE